MSDQTTNFKFTGDATGVQEAAKKAQGAIKDTGDAAKQMSATTVASGVLVADVFKKIGGEALRLAKDVLGSFSSVAGETRSLQRVLGGTAEDMSRLRFTSEELGVSTESMTKSMVIAYGHFLKNDDAAKRMGISVRDASGQMKPSVQVLGEIGDRLARVSNAQERATLTRQLFGRAGLDLLPILSQGSEGMKKFADESDKLGLTLSQKDLNSSRQMTLAVKEMKASFEGLWVSVGREVVPVMKVLADGVSEGVAWFREMWSSGSALSQVLHVIAAGVAAVAAGAVVVTAAVKAWAIAQSVLNVIMDANPIGLVILAIVGLAGALIALVKNFKPVGDAMVIVGQVMGTGIGWGVNIALKAISLLASGLSKIVDQGLAVAGFFAKLADAVGGIFNFDVNLEGKIGSIRSGLKNITGIVTGTLDDWASTAAAKGGEIGVKLMAGLVDAIKNLHMPTIPDLGKTPATGPVFEPDWGSGGKGGGKARNPLEDRIKAMKDFFKQLVDASRAGLNELRQNAIEARKQMADAGRQIGQSIADGFSLSALTESSFAAYNGIGRLTDAFQRRLAGLRAFVANIRKLIGLGLPQAMLLDLVNAGPEQGGPAAALLAANPQSIGEFRNIQKQIDQQSSALGGIVAKAQYGAGVAAAENAAAAAQKQFIGYLGAAKQSGLYRPTADDMSAARASVHNEISVVVTEPRATGAQIADALAWALKNAGRIPAGMKATP